MTGPPTQRERPALAEPGRGGAHDLAGYACDDEEMVRLFLRARAGMVPVLRQALTHIREAFGDVTPRLSLDRSEVAAPESLLVSIPTSKDAKAAFAAMNRFEDGWWMDALPDAGGSVNFTVEFS